MSDLDALLAGIVADPTDALRWLVMADWLEDHGQPERAELVRVHRELLRTCTTTRETKARKQLHARMMELMRGGVQPCLPQRTITLPGGVEMRFSFIPPGSFLMGCPKSEVDRQVEERRHRVTLKKGFWMGVSPVTQRQWVTVMGTNPSRFQGDELPVEQVRWEDAQEYRAAVMAQMAVNLRLPTEAEWEYAARAGTTTPFYWGQELNGTQANCDDRHPYETKSMRSPRKKVTTVVGSYVSVSPHPWGLVDMIGNVWEWCGSYPDRDRTDSADSKPGSDRLGRGGSCISLPMECRAGCRLWPSPDLRHASFGFRVAADLSALA